MPAEIRHLVFAEDEAIIALREYYKRSGKSLPDRAVLSLAIISDEPPAVTLSSRATRHRPSIEYGVSGEDLLSALILYCHSQRVPLPVRGSKALTVVKDRLTIVIKLPRQQLRARAA